MNLENTVICCLMLVLPFDATCLSDVMSRFSTLQPSPAKTSLRASSSLQEEPLTSDSVILSTPGPSNGLRRMSADRVELRLLQDLFYGYDKRLRPVLRREDNVTVKLGISLHQLVDLDERNQVTRLSCWVRQVWYNPFLRWNKTHYSGISEINIEPTDVWKPDLVLYNNADDSTDGSLARFKTQIKVNSEGMNMWLSPVILRSSCKITVKYFPFDEQHCELKFGSWTYDGLHLDLIPEAPTANLVKFVKNGEWDLVGVPCKRNVVKYVCCEAPYPDVTYVVQIRRRTLFFFFNLVIPCLVIVALTILSFYLPPDSGERISLVITNLLAMTVFMLLVAEIIPPTSDEVSIISIFYSCCIFEVGLALIGTCVVLKYHFANPSIHKMPGWIRFVVIHCLGRVFKNKAHDVKSDESYNEKSAQAQQGNCVGGKDSAFIEPFIPKSDQLYRRYSGIGKRLSEMSTGTWPIDLRFHSIAETSEKDSKGPFPENRNDHHEHESFFIRALIHKQSAIADALKKLVETQAAQDEEVKEKVEWMIAASIMDSMFLWLFLVMLVVSFLALFFRIPNYANS